MSAMPGAFIATKSTKSSNQQKAILCVFVLLCGYSFLPVKGSSGKFWSFKVACPDVL